MFEGDFRYQHVWIVDVATKQSARITEGTTYTLQGAPSWSPDSKRLVFAAATTPMLRDNRRDVYIADLDEQADREDQHQLRQRRAAAMVARRRDASRGSPSRTPATPLPDGTASGVIMQQRLMLYDVDAKTIKDALRPTSIPMPAPRCGPPKASA